MLGMGDGWVLFAWCANIGVTLVCVVYGVINWNRGGDDCEGRKRK